MLSPSVMALGLEHLNGLTVEQCVIVSEAGFRWQGGKRCRRLAGWNTQGLEYVLVRNDCGARVLHSRPYGRRRAACVLMMKRIEFREIH